MNRLTHCMVGSLIFKVPENQDWDFELSLVVCGRFSPLAAYSKSQFCFSTVIAGFSDLLLIMVS